MKHIIITLASLIVLLSACTKVDQPKAKANPYVGYYELMSMVIEGVASDGTPIRDSVRFREYEKVCSFRNDGVSCGIFAGKYTVDGNTISVTYALGGATGVFTAEWENSALLDLSQWDAGHHYKTTYHLHLMGWKDADDPCCSLY